ncbi:MAG: hypothetical protein ACQERD_06350 [Campylobacterota bacterium]
MKFILSILAIVFVFVGCSSKKYFEPKNVKGDFVSTYNSLPSEIKSINRAGATLESQEFISKNGISKKQLPEGFEFLNLSDTQKVIATNKKDKILVGDKKIEVNDVVVGASLKGNILAILYSNNSIELIDTNTNKTVFKEYLIKSLANDTRLVNPYFMGNLILFPTLNGKIVIVSAQNFKSVRTISVDPDGQFNNIIFLEIDEETQTLITATANKIVSISPQEVLSQDYEIRDLILENSFIYLATIDGRVIKLSLDLNELNTQKFKYSKIHALAYNNSNIYAIESQGYVIKTDTNFNKSEILDFNFTNTDRLIVIDNKIYFSNNHITLP